MWRTRNCFKVIMAVENYAPNRGEQKGMKTGAQKQATAVDNDGAFNGIRQDVAVCVCVCACVLKTGDNRHEDRGREKEREREIGREIENIECPWLTQSI